MRFRQPEIAKISETVEIVERSEIVSMFFCHIPKLSSEIDPPLRCKDAKIPKLTMLSWDLNTSKF